MQKARSPKAQLNTKYRFFGPDAPSRYKPGPVAGNAPAAARGPKPQPPEFLACYVRKTSLLNQ